MYKLIFLILIILVIHIKAMEFVYRIGSNFYEKQRKGNKIWDIIHANCEDYSRYNYKKNIYTLIFITPLIYGCLTNNISIDFCIEFILKFLVIIFLRSISIMVTILPRNKKVKKKSKAYEKLSIYEKLIGGGCYDKMFSGHFAFGLLLTLLMFKYNIITTNVINVLFFGILNITHIFILSITRSHYTMDMIISLYITLFVYNLNLNVNII